MLKKILITLMLLIFSSIILSASSYSPRVSTEANAVFSFIENREWTRFSLRSKLDLIAFELRDNTFSLPLSISLSSASTPQDGNVLQEDYDFLLSFSYRRRLIGMLGLELETGCLIRYYPLLESFLMGLEGSLALELYPLDFIGVYLPIRVSYLKGEYDLSFGLGISLVFKTGGER